MSNSPVHRSEYAVRTELSHLLTIVNDDEALRRYLCSRSMSDDLNDLVDHLPPVKRSEWYREHTPLLLKVRDLEVRQSLDR